MTFMTPDVLLDHDSNSGRTRQSKDGSFSAYDLRDASEGDMLAIRSGEDVHIFVKEAAGEYEDARQNWRLLAERELGSAVKLVLLEPNKFGTSFLTHGIVLKQGMELGVVECEEAERSIKSLGVVAGIAYAATAETDDLAADMQLV